jgi:subtilase family protein
MFRVRVGIIDSGVNPVHPHVGEIAGGVAFGSPVYLDYLGHGTAVAGAIREKAPDAELYAVKVFNRTLSTSVDTLVQALEWCLEHEMDVINLSLGTVKPGRLEPLLARSTALVVSTRNLAVSIPVDLDQACPREVYRYAANVFYASGYARPIPGVPPDRNLNGISFAVANMTGFVARARQSCAPGEVRARLIQEAS